MPKPRKKLILLLAYLFLAAPLFSQNSVSYSYDSMGNRISRVASEGDIASATELTDSLRQASIPWDVASSGSLHASRHGWLPHFVIYYLHDSFRLEPDARAEKFQADFKSWALGRT